MKSKDMPEIKDLEMKLENGISVYSYDKAVEKLKQLRPKKLLVSDVILLLLYARKDVPIYGRIMLMKEVFLLTKKILDQKEIEDAKFFGYQFGPYSHVVYDSLQNLAFSGFIKTKGRKDTKTEEFSLAPAGITKIQPVFNSLSDGMRKAITDARIGWDQLEARGIIKLVYRDFPEYTEESRIKDYKKFKAVKWGRGRA
jgi:uncharacterized protein YwgA